MFSREDGALFMSYIVKLAERTVSRAMIGGKAYNLSVLARLPGVAVPRGFCVTSEAFDAFATPICLPANIYKVQDIREFSRQSKSVVLRQKIPEPILEELTSMLPQY